MFYVLDLEKEEKWLREMANKGWFFQKVDVLNIYTFVKGPCKDVIYKIDFNKKIEDAEEYYDLFNQCGWKSIYKKRHLNYFQFTGDASNFTNEENTHTEEQLTWLRKLLIILLIAYGMNFVCLFSLFSFQQTFYNNSSSIKIITACITLVSVELVWYVNSYIILKKKIKEKDYKDYYDRNVYKRASSVVSLFIFPVLVCGLLFITFTHIYTVGGSDKAIKHKILQGDKYSLYPMKTVDYIVAQDINNSKVGIYGNSDRIGMITLDKVFLNRYKVTCNFSCELAPNQLAIEKRLVIGKDNYLTIYGKEDKQKIDRIALVYEDGTKDELTNDSFIRKENCFFVLKRANKTLDKIKVYDRDNVDITDRYVNFQ